VMTLTSLAQEYFTEIDAPMQGMTLIPDAGHLAAFYQPEAFLAALLASRDASGGSRTAYPAGRS